MSGRKEKVKTRTYTVISDDYDNTHVAGRIVGPAAPALSTLLKRFKEKYGYQEYKVLSYGNICKQNEAKARMEADGLVGWDLAELFIHWCIRDHKFRSIEKDVFYV